MLFSYLILNLVEIQEFDISPPFCGGWLHLVRDNVLRELRAESLTTSKTEKEDSVILKDEVRVGKAWCWFSIMTRQVVVCAFGDVVSRGGIDIDSGG